MNSIEDMTGPVMVITAHPDDIEVHSSGTVAQLVSAGREVTCVLCSSGNRGTGDPEVTMEKLAKLREEEQLAASRVLGVQDVRFLRYDDGDLSFVVPQLREKIVRLIRQVRPQSIITHDPYPGDGGQDSCSIYPDHIAVGLTAFQSAYVCAPGPLFYPVHYKDGLKPYKPHIMYLIMSSNPNFFIDISSVWEMKLRALSHHRTQGRHTPENDQEMERIARENGGRSGFTLAEAFRILLPT